MAKATYWQKGQTIDYTNPSSSAAIAAGEIVELAARIGVAATDIPASGIGTVVTEGVFILPRDAADSSAIAVGAAVHWNSSKSAIVAAAAESGTIPAGWCVEACAAAATTIKVKLIG